jgi:hypothetical protein
MYFSCRYTYIYLILHHCFRKIFQLKFRDNTTVIFLDSFHNLLGQPTVLTHDNPSRLKMGEKKGE